MEEEKKAEQEEEKETEPKDSEQGQEGANEKEGKEEKKENAFSKFFKKTKENINASVLEGKIESAFNKAHSEYTIYTKGKTFPSRAFGFIENGALTIFGEEQIDAFSVVIGEDKKAYYTGEISAATVKSEVEGITYERPGTTIALDENVEEVVVVKAGDRYFLYKGETEKK